MYMDELMRGSGPVVPASDPDLLRQRDQLVQRLAAKDAEHAKEKAVLTRKIRLLEDEVRKLKREARRATA